MFSKIVLIVKMKLGLVGLSLNHFAVIGKGGGLLLALGSVAFVFWPT